MPIDTEDAESYELPPLATSSKYPTEDVDDEEAAALLNGDGADKEVKLNGISGHAFRVDGDDLVGKGSKIEELIAEVSCTQFHVPRRRADKRTQHVPATDDPSLPTLTLRVLLIGSFFCLLGASASQVFYFKSNAPSFSSYFVILATYPLGHFLANERVCGRGRRILGMELNPGPFSIKEAILVRCAYTFPLGTS